MGAEVLVRECSEGNVVCKFDAVVIGDLGSHGSIEVEDKSVTLCPESFEKEFDLVAVGM